MQHAFRNRSARAMYDLHSGPNMTPMVDVVMVILIFFMASAAMLGPEWFLKTALPSKPAAGAPAPEHLTLSLRLTGLSAGVTINQGPELLMPLDAAEGVLAARLLAVGSDNLTVLIRPEQDASYDVVVRMHETCARLGITRVGIAEPAPR